MPIDLKKIRIRPLKLIKPFLFCRIVISFFYRTSIYWRIRHVFDRSCWNTQFSYSSESLRDIYSRIFKKYQFRYAFEFGCGSAPNCKNIHINYSESIVYFGYDISKVAIQTAMRNFSPINTRFFNRISKSILINSLKEHEVQSFDCAIFHRVLYLLTQDKVIKHFEEFSDLYKYILIYDFHSISPAKEKSLIHNYYIKDYVDLLSSFGFYLIHKQKTDPNSESKYFRDNAHLLFFKNSKYDCL